jgi:hypothetical protein
VGFVRDSSVQFLTILYSSGSFADGRVRPRTENSQGGAKHEKWDKHPLEPNSVDHRERVGDNAVGRIQFISASRVQWSSVVCR